MMHGAAAQIILLALSCLFFAGAVLTGARGWRRTRGERDAARLEARTDALTGRPNRRALDEALAQVGEGQALLFADLDGFKAVNDARGHAAGDRLLAAVAAAWPHDAFVARYGGDEFVALAPVLKAERLAHAMIEATARASGGAVTLSVGLARGDPATLLLRADRALARAKARGGGVLVLDRPSLACVRDAA